MVSAAADSNLSDRDARSMVSAAAYSNLSDRDAWSMVSAAAHPNLSDRDAWSMVSAAAHTMVSDRNSALSTDTAVPGYGAMPPDRAFSLHRCVPISGGRMSLSARWVRNSLDADQPGRIHRRWVRRLKRRDT